MPIFQFFDLPRELRDNIYALLLTENQKSGSGLDTPAWYSRPMFYYMPMVRFQLVSRQFGEEYTEAIKPYSTMIIYNSPNAGINHKQYISQIRNIQIEFSLSCKATPIGINTNCHPAPHQVKDDKDVTDELPFTCQGVMECKYWVERLHKLGPNLPSHQKLGLRIGIDWFSDEEFSWPRHIHAPGLQFQLDAMTKALPTVNSVEVALFDYDENYESWNKNELDMGLWVTWTKGGGWQAGEAKGRRRVDA
jgi:hypothetical protein